MITLAEHERLDLPGADVFYRPGWLPSDLAQALFAQLLAQTAWEQPVYNFHGQDVPMPRQVAWHSATGARYAYSGIRHTPSAWSESLADLQARLLATTGAAFNHVLINRYRSGRDSVAWHSDDERELRPLIASVSLGATRRFSFKPKAGGAITSLDLEPGSLLIMGGATQRTYLHQIPKTTKPVGERINLTFRQMVTDPQIAG